MRRPRILAAWRRLALPALVASLAVTTQAAAQPLDAAAARAQLTEGYELRAQGKFAEAYPHLVESLRLDRQLKALLNLADCEEHLGKLGDAQQHWVQARDVAVDGSAEKQGAVARLAALERRMPRLIIRLEPGAPPGSEVLRDGVVLGAVSLGAPLPLDPGAHMVTVRAVGWAARTFDVTLAESETKELVVAPGAKSDTSEAPPAVVGKPEQLPRATPSLPPETATASSPWRTVGLVTGGVGVAGLAVGTVFGALALQKKNQAGCNGSECPTASAGATRNDAQNAGNLSTVFSAMGAVLAVGGIALWLLAPKSSSSVQVAPSVGQGGAGIALGGRF